ncbi:MAG: ATP-dependent helicase C-terminal domain-containing protein [Corynebacterium sp.]|nr:ATP-dependent helicase C-terminal domain-containing protein [Corynebacterium sp.]
MDFQDLPVAAHEKELIAAWDNGQNLVIIAPPGTGKTTFVPPLVAGLQNELVLVIVPRRIAAIAAAKRLWDLGMERSEVGYAVRGKHHSGSRIMFITPGVMLARLMSDPELSGVGVVIIDELHERQMQVDLIFAFLNELRALRDLRVIAMSATIDSDSVAELLDATVVEISAPIHPLEIEYCPIAGRMEGSREFYAGVADLARRAYGDGSVLVFLPGIREIRMVAGLLDNFPVFILHGQVSPDLPTGDEPLIILSTAIAESSVTVPGVRAVVDTGLGKEKNGRGLFTVSISQASATQRAGRAGRLGPGRVFRAYREQEFHNMAPYSVPEILRSDLTDAALYLAAWGTPRAEGLAMLDLPPVVALDKAEEELRSLGAIDEFGGCTAHGQELARIPMEPHLAHALVTLGSGAAPVLGTISDGVRGNLDRVKHEKNSKFAKYSQDKGQYSVGFVVGSAFPRQIAKKMGEEYQLVSGQRLKLPEPGPEWIAVADWMRPMILSWAEIDNPEEIVPVEETVLAISQNYRVKGVRERHMGAIVLSQAPAQITEQQAKQALMEEVRADLLRDSEAKTQIRRCVDYWRLNFLHQTLGAPWPDMSMEALAESIESWFSDLNWENNLKNLYPWPEAAKIDELAPLKFLGKYKVDYSGEQPKVRAKLQDLFGYRDTGEICGRPILFELLSPAQRPLATTSDLTSFFAGPYKQVRAEMRGRYPKHDWPENP